MKQAALLLSMAFVMAGSLTGCGGSSTSEPSPSRGNNGGQETSTSEDSSNSAASEEAKEREIESALAELSPADADAARQQQTCPVSGELLGSMGAPQKVIVKEHDVWICCAACEGELKENADEYLSQLNKD